MTMEDMEAEDWGSDYYNLCHSLSMDEQTINEAKAKYRNAEASVKLEDKPIYWLACALYDCCYSKQLVLVNGEISKGNYLSMTQLLKSLGLSFEVFVQKYLYIWTITANRNDDFRDHVEKIRRKWVVMSHIFKKYKNIYDSVCQPIKDADFRKKRIKIQRTLNSAELYKFIWTFYCYIKANFPQSIEDVMSSSQLLLVVADYCFSQVYMSDPEILSEDVQEHFRKVEGNTIIEMLCENFLERLGSVEPKRIRDYHFKPLLKGLFINGILKGGNSDSEIFNSSVFDCNVKSVKNEYDVFVLKQGEYDNRLFLETVGGIQRSLGDRTPTKSTVVSRTPTLKDTESLKVRRNLMKQLDNLDVPQTPLSNRSFLPARTAEDMVPRTPISEQADILNRLTNLIINYKTTPSDRLEQILSQQPPQVREDIITTHKELSERFTRQFCNGAENALDFARQRLDKSSRLFYRLFELIISSELKRCSGKSIQMIMTKKEIISALFAISVEIVLNTYGSNERKFPWILNVLELHPIDVYKIIELIVMNDTGLSRKIIKHLNTIEESMLETMVWGVNSPMYDRLERNCNPSRPPRYEDVKPRGNSTPNIRSEDFRNHGRFGTMGGSGGGGGTPKKCLLGFTPLSTTTSSPFEQMERSGGGGGGCGSRNIAPLPQPNLRVVVPTLDPGPSSNSPPGANTGSQTPVSALASRVDTFGVMSPPPQPKHPKSLLMFFRKVYNLVYLRMKNIAEKLDITSDTLQQVWTVFEHALTHHLSLFHGRHIDQILICSTYLVTKAASMNITFRKIIECYREQPQVQQHIYRNVLLRSQPLSERLTCDCRVSTETAEKGDIIKFYNQVFITHLTPFIRLTEGQNSLNLAAPLSPMPTMLSLVPENANAFSPRRFESHNLTVSPRRPYIFGQSPTKQLERMNKEIQGSRPEKRPLFSLSDQQEVLSDSKKSVLTKFMKTMKYDN